MTSLANILPEPENGTTVILTGPTMQGHLVITRDDERSAREGYEYSNWFHARPDHWNPEPLTWELFTKYATKAWALGPLLADLEAER